MTPFNGTCDFLLTRNALILFIRYSTHKYFECVYNSACRSVATPPPHTSDIFQLELLDANQSLRIDGGPALPIGRRNCSYKLLRTGAEHN